MNEHRNGPFSLQSSPALSSPPRPLLTMRSFITPLLVAGLAAAAPAPQNIDFDLVYEAPKPTYTIAQDVAAQTVVYDPASVIASAAAQITAAAPDESSAPVEKRAACNALPAGTGPPVNNPDTPAAFLASQAFADSANNAGTPSGYTQTFKNLKASNNAYGYLGFTTLDSYDVQACAVSFFALKLLPSSLPDSHDLDLM